MAVIGIDLGTTNSLCVTYRNNKVELIPNAFNEYLTPSAVWIKDDEVIVGKIARQRLVSDPAHTASLFKRAMGTNKLYELDNKKFTPSQLSSFVVKQLIYDAEVYLNEKVEEVIVSVPAYFNARQRKATKEIGSILGIKLDRLINEPSAAAIACHDMPDYETFVVYDFGGGTLDVSVVDCFENVVSITSICGNNHLGGSDFDRAIAYYFCAKNNLVFEKLNDSIKASLMMAAERCKIYLSDHDQAIMKLSIKDKMYEYTITKEKLKEICLPILENAKIVIAKAVKDSGFTADELDSLILVGGSSKMPLVQEYLSDLLSIPIEQTRDFDQLVAMGLGKYIGIKQRSESIKDMVVTDICPFSLSTAVINDVEPDKLLSKVIIERNSVLPCSKTVMLQTARLGQKKLDVEVFQGESMYAKDNLQLGKTSIDIPINHQVHEQFALTYTYDINSMLYVEIHILSTNEIYIFQVGQSSDFEKVTSTKQLDSIKNVSLQLNKNPEYEMVLEKAKRIYMEMDAQGQDWLRDMVLRFIKLYERNTNNIKKKALLIEEMDHLLDRYDLNHIYENMDIFKNEEDENEGMLS